jgi:putative protease
LETLTHQRRENYSREPAKPRPAIEPFFQEHLDFTANVSNQKSVEFYQKRGVKIIDPAFELGQSGPGTVVMTLRQCVLKALGQCRKEVKTSPEMWKDPLFLENKAGRFLLEFDCTGCEMQIRII